MYDEDADVDQLAHTYKHRIYEVCPDCGYKRPSPPASGEMHIEYAAQLRRNMLNMLVAAMEKLEEVRSKMAMSTAYSHQQAMIERAIEECRSAMCLPSELEIKEAAKTSTQ